MGSAPSHRPESWDYHRNSPGSLVRLVGLPWDQQTFAAALEAGGFSSWVGGASDGTQWLVKKFGDVYPHETVISHIRRLLEDDFACRRLGETVPQFTQRIQKVAQHRSSPGFAAADGRGFQGLVTQLHERCRRVVKEQGKRYPK